MFLDGVFVAARTTGRGEGWYTSPYAHDLNAKVAAALRSTKTSCENPIFDPLNSVYGLGFDFGQIMTNKRVSGGIVGIRCEDVPSRMLGLASAGHPVIILPAGKEPHHLDVYFEPFVVELLEIGTNGVRVTTPASEEGGLPTTFVHRAFLSAIYADAMARLKLVRCMMSAAAILGCQFCCFNGVIVNTTTRFLG